MICYNLTNRFKKYGHFKSRLDEYKYDHFWYSKFKCYSYPEDWIPNYEITVETADNGITLDGTWDDLTPINEVNHPKYIKIKKIDLERRINFNEIRSKNS